MTRTPEEITACIEVAMRRKPADYVIKGARIFDLITGELRRQDIAICGCRIAAIGEAYDGIRQIDAQGLTAVPGFTDAHCHIESSMVTPQAWERMVLPRGITSAVCDPHELVNVAGTAALDYFIAAAQTLLMHLQVQIPSCVPALPSEEAGARLDACALSPYASRQALAEFMNVPGVISADTDVVNKLAAFSGRPIDGHAPLVSGDALNALCAAGITNDHECSTPEEALLKLRSGMTILIRAGSVGRNLEALAPLLEMELSGNLCLCTDDRDPRDVMREGHLDAAIRKAIALGRDPLAVYRAACLTPARHFGWRDRGLLAPGYRADIVLMPDLADCRAQIVFANGTLVTEEAFNARPPAPDCAPFRNSIQLNRPFSAADFAAPDAENRVIQVTDGTLLTAETTREACEIAPAILALAARHGTSSKIGKAWVQGFALTEGALASTVGHDSHNLCVVGSSPEAMAIAANALRDCGGGFAVVQGGKVTGLLPLPIGGLLSDAPWTEVAAALEQLHAAAHATGCPLSNPFLALAFLPLPVIPSARITLEGHLTL